MAEIKSLSCDIETFSSINLAKAGVYRYVESPDFEILLFGYSIDCGPVQVVDLACGEKIPDEILSAITDESVMKWAFNANFERICLSRHLGYPTGEYIDSASWRCSMVWAATMGLPLSLEGIGSVSGSLIATFLYIAASEWWLRGLDMGKFLGIEAPNLFRSGFRRFVFSIIIMMIVLFFSKGLMGDKEISFAGLVKRFKKRAKVAKGGGIDG